MWWIYAAVFGLGVAQRLDFNRTLRSLVTERNSIIQWNREAVERHVMRSMGIGVGVAWLMITLLYTGGVLGTALYSATTAVMAGAGAALMLAPKRKDAVTCGNGPDIGATTMTQETLIRELVGVKRAGNDATFWGCAIPVTVGGGTAIMTLEWSVWLLLMAGALVGLHWLIDKARAYKDSVAQFMKEDNTGGLSQEIDKLDDITTDPGLAPGGVKLLVPLLTLMEGTSHWILSLKGIQDKDKRHK